MANVPIPGCVVVVQSRKDWHPATIAEVLARTLKMTETDAIHRLSGEHGLLMPGCSMENAALLEVALGRAGIRARAMHVADLPVLPRPSFVVSGQYSEAGLLLTDEENREYLVEWERFAIAALASLTERVEERIRYPRVPTEEEEVAQMHAAQDGLGAGYHPPLPPSHESRVKRSFVLDLVAVRPTERFRVDPGAFSLDGEYSYADFLNARRLLHLVQSGRSELLLNEYADDFMAKRPLNKGGDLSPDSLDREEHWLLTTLGLKD